MRISQQIGWSQESKLIYNILKQLDRLEVVWDGCCAPPVCTCNIYTVVQENPDMVVSHTYTECTESGNVLVTTNFAYGVWLVCACSDILDDVPATIEISPAGASCTAPPTTTTTTTTSVTYTIGELALGGVIGYILQPGDPGYDANVQHGLVATVNDISTSAEWGCIGTLIGTTSNSIGTGNQNTIDIMADCSTAGIAARLCGDLVEGGYSDWYLPSKDELEKLYINQVAIGNFAIDFYWSSSEFSDTTAYLQFFGNGIFFGTTKDIPYYVRAVRSF